MSDERPKGSYAWLYGDDEQTRQAPRVTSSGQPSPQLPPPNLPPPGGKGRGAEPPKPKKRRTGRRVVGILVLAWIVFLVAVPVWAWGKIAKVDAEPEGARPSDQPGTTYLLVGSDSRRGLTKAEQKELSTGGDGGGRGRTDTIMMLHTGSGPSVLMSIPRDSLVEIPGYGRTKINAAYAYGGPKLLVKTIEKNTGIRVDDYVEVGFGGLVKVVDSLGGVEICPKEDIKDKDSGLDVKKGCQTADGGTALAYSRNRHTYANQDIGRVQAQREVLGSIASEAKSPWTLLNPLRYQKVAAGASGSLTIGENVGPISLGRFALSLSSAMSGKGLNCTVPLRDFAVTWDPERAPKMFDLIIKDRSEDIGSLCTKDGLPKS
jgi:LCP family protein required for cell wall assembly